jgi:hypothetical protein
LILPGAVAFCRRARSFERTGTCMTHPRPAPPGAGRLPRVNPLTGKKKDQA